MPFTPFHFGPNACVALPLNRYIDLPAFLLASVAIDIELLLVLLLGLFYPLHGYAHTLIGAALVGLAWGWMAYSLGRPLTDLMTKAFGLSYSPVRNRVLVSGVLGSFPHRLGRSAVHRHPAIQALVGESPVRHDCCACHVRVLL